MQEEITKKLDELAFSILHCTDEVLGMDLSGDEKQKISGMQLDVLLAFNKLVAEIKRNIQ